MRSTRHIVRIAGFVLVCLLAAGCVPKAYREHPDFMERARVISAPGVLPVDVTIYEISAGGVSEVRKEWCDLGAMNVAKALNAQLENKAYDVKPIVVPPELEPEVAELTALYYAVDASIRMHTYPTPATFQDKVDRFEYSVGPVAGLMEKLDVDAFVLVTCTDEVTSAGRKAVMITAVIAGALAGVQVVPAGAMTHGSVAVIDPTGDIIWYNQHTGQWAYDLRNYDSAHAMVEQMLKDLPGASE